MSLQQFSTSLRINASTPDHHLWNSPGTWWCHYTDHRSDFTKRRVRVSLDTPHALEARRRKDDLLWKEKRK